VLSDDLIHPIHPFEEIDTNSCRALTTNWMEGHIWAAFSSDQYKERPTGGPGFYRDMPLLGIWATAPFFLSGGITVREIPAAAAPADPPWLAHFRASLERADLAPATVLGYLKDVRQFLRWQACADDFPTLTELELIA
jgi:hypothetical protein